MSAAERGRNSGQGVDAPGQDDPDALVEDINRTRAELGDTVEALVAKADVKARAQQRAAEVSTAARGKLQAMKQELAGRASQLTGQAAQTRQVTAANGKTMLEAGTAGGKTVLGNGRTAVGQLTGHAAQAGSAALRTAPAPVQRGAQQVARTVSRHRVPFAAAAGAALVVGWLAIRWRRR